MTDADKPAFRQAISRLAVALREKEPDLVMMRVYFDALKDLAVEFVEMAARRLVLEATWFPKTSEWRTMAAKIEAERREAQRARLRSLPSPLCTVCGDTGWTTQDAGEKAYITRHRNLETGRVDEISTSVPTVRRCECAELRRLELLGRRESPALPAAAGSLPDERIDPDESVSLMTTIERRTGLKIAPRVMPRAPYGVGPGTDGSA